jgi:hypothetical protein
VITPEVLKTAIVMVGRASCSGTEARDVAAALEALVETYNQMVSQKVPPEPQGD